jgi:hypothetical protein
VDEQGLKAALAALDEMSYGRERLSRREELVAEAERLGHPGWLAYALLDLVDDALQIGEEQQMVLSYGRAWRLFTSRPEVAGEESLRWRYREHFKDVVDALDRDERVPRAEVDRLADEMEQFYRASGFSLRAVHRVRHWIHRRRGEKEKASEQIELAIDAEADVRQHCDACECTTGAEWYWEIDNYDRAVQLWQAVLAAGSRCSRQHDAIAHAALTSVLRTAGRIDEARTHFEAGYPLARRRRQLAWQLQLLMLYLIRTRDYARAVDVLHDHADWLPLGRPDRGDPNAEPGFSAAAAENLTGNQWWFLGRVRTLLKVLIDNAAADLPVTVPTWRGDDGSEAVGAGIVRASVLLDQLDTAMAAIGRAKDPGSSSGTWWTVRLEEFRSAAIPRVVLPRRDPDDPEAAWAPVPTPWSEPQNAADRPELPAGFGLTDLLAARARALTYLNHPHAYAVWAQVAAAAGAQAEAEAEAEPGTRAISPDVEAELAEHALWSAAARGDMEASARHLDGATARYIDLGRLADAVRLGAQAVYKLVYLDGEEQEAQRLWEVMRAQAQSVFKREEITPGQYIRVLLPGFHQLSHRLTRIIETDPHDGDPDFDGATEAYNTDSSLVVDAIVANVTRFEMGMMQRAREHVNDAYARLYEDHGQSARVESLRGKALYWLDGAADTFSARTLIWPAVHAQAARGRQLVRAKQWPEAEQSARLAAEWDVAASTGLDGLIALTLAEAIEGQTGRDDEAAAAAAEAAALLAGADPVGAARARLILARVRFRAGDHEQAEQLFGPAFDELEGRWADDAWLRAAAIDAIRDRATGLMELDRARDAIPFLLRVLARFPEKTRGARAVVLYKLGEAYEACDERREAARRFVEAAEECERTGWVEMRYNSYRSGAKILSFVDLPGALALLDHAAESDGLPLAEGAKARNAAAATASAEATAGQTDEEAAAKAAEQAAEQAARAAREAEQADRFKRFEIAYVRAFAPTIVLYQFDTEKTVPREVVDELLPARLDGARVALAELAGMLDEPREGDRRAAMGRAAHAAVVSLASAATVLQDDHAAAARTYAQFAQDCDRWGLGELAATARRQAADQEREAAGAAGAAGSVEGAHDAGG